MCGCFCMFFGWCCILTLCFLPVRLISLLNNCVSVCVCVPVVCVIYFMVHPIHMILSQVCWDLMLFCNLFCFEEVCKNISVGLYRISKWNKKVTLYWNVVIYLCLWVLHFFYLSLFSSTNCCKLYYYELHQWVLFSSYYNIFHYIAWGPKMAPVCLCVHRSSLIWAHYPN